MPGRESSGTVAECCINLGPGHHPALPLVITHLVPTWPREQQGCPPLPSMSLLHLSPRLPKGAWAIYASTKSRPPRPLVLWEADDVSASMLLKRASLSLLTHRPWEGRRPREDRELASHLNLSFDFLFFLFFPTIP